jgi:hypothetical protein
MDVRLRSEKLEWVHAGDEVVVLDESELAYISTNASGAMLWQELARGTTRERLISRLIDAFAIEVDVATRDVDAFLADARRRGLLEG